MRPDARSVTVRRTLAHSIETTSLSAPHERDDFYDIQEPRAVHCEPVAPAAQDGTGHRRRFR